MRLFIPQSLFYLFSIQLVLMNQVESPRQLITQGNTNIYAASCDVKLARKFGELQFKIPFGLGILSHRTDGSIFVYNWGKCLITADMSKQQSVQVKVLRGNIIANGIENLDIELGRGDIFTEDIEKLVIRLGKGDVYGTLPSNSVNRIDVIRGNVDVQLEEGNWHHDIRAKRKNLLFQSLEMQQLDGTLTINSPNGRAKVWNVSVFASDI